MKRSLRIFLILVMGILIAPTLHQLFPVFQTDKLAGSFIAAPVPVLTDSSWFTGVYQSQKSREIEENIGFRPDLVRLYNQIDFSLFRIPHAEKIIVGKEGYLLAQQYIDAFLGLDFVGEVMLREKVNRFVLIQDELWNQKHQLLVLVFPPDKGTFYPEFIPERYLRKKRLETNYSLYRGELQRSGANFIDFNNYFLTLKDSSHYVLYPKTGIHWSTYGALMAADSLSKYIETKLDAKLPRMIIDSIVVTDELRSPDGDIGVTMNLMHEISHPEMAYPVIHFDTSGRKKINALVIGDSFYWNWYYSGYIKNTFENENFWYYNKDAYPEHFTNPTNIWDINRQEIIAQADVIIILLVNAGYGNIGYGLLEELANYLGMADPRVAEIMEQMKNSEEWMNALKAKARERNIPLQKMMEIDARYVLDQELQMQK